MKFKAFKAVAAVAAMGCSLGLATPSLAEGGPEFSFNLGATTDYVWRGFSQSDEGPAIQGGIDVTSGGFYAGTWASSVDFGDGTEAEWDFYAGYSTTSGPIDIDIGFTYYTYVGDPSGSGYDFLELKIAASHTFENFTVGAALHHSPDFYGADEKATFIEVTGEYAINDKWAISGGIGKQMLDIGADYGTWNLGVGYAFSDNLSVDVRYWDADVSSPLSDPRVTVGLGIAF